MIQRLRSIRVTCHCRVKLSMWGWEGQMNANFILCCTMFFALIPNLRLGWLFRKQRHKCFSWMSLTHSSGWLLRLLDTPLLLLFKANQQKHLKHYHFVLVSNSLSCRYYDDENNWNENKFVFSFVVPLCIVRTSRVMKYENKNDRNFVDMFTCKTAEHRRIWR